MRYLQVMAHLIVMLAAVSSAQAQNEKAEVARCAGIGSPVSRLACYDEVAKRFASIEAQPAAQDAGRWKVISERSPIDDSENVYLMVDAENSIHGLVGSVTPTLLLRCKEGRTEAYVDWSTYLGLDETTVLIRLDEEKATRSQWGISTDNKATFYRGDHTTFVRNLLGHKTLLAQVTPYGESPVLANFPLSGMEGGVKQLQEACGWQ